MRIALFSDLHAHPFKPYASVLDNGMNSRLADAISCLDQIREICVEQGVELALFGGDMFHVRRNINVTAFNAVYEALAKFHLAKIPVAMIHGNHDQSDRDGKEHSVHAFRTFCTVIDEPGWVQLETQSKKRVSVLAVPYLEDVDRLRAVTARSCPHTDSDVTVGLGHFGVQGAKVGADFVYCNEGDPCLADMNAANVDKFFLGHYHLYQHVGENVWYIGAPLQHNWGDRGQHRGFLIWDTTKNIHEQIQLDAPEFVETMTLDEKHRGNFVRLVTDTPMAASEVEWAVEQYGLRSLEVRSFEEEEDSEVRIELAPGTSLHDSIETYVNSGVQPVGDLDTDYLVKLGQEILEEL